MTTMQIYDKEGTTNFQYTYVEKIGKKIKEEWNVFFTQGFISISNVYNITKIKVNFPEDDHWIYEEREETSTEGCFERGGEIKNNHFTLKVDVREYMDINNPVFNPDYHETGDPEGYIVLDNKIITVELPIPYKLALSIMKFMTGSTNLDGVCGVIRK
jgi:hypothetical protein